jgi:hypothetical protein
MRVKVINLPNCEDLIKSSFFFIIFCEDVVVVGLTFEPCICQVPVIVFENYDILPLELV